MSSIEPPVYSRIALDIAMRIARGDIKENTKISGRSLMASEYNVSPETIRRSFKLLDDMKIINVLPGSGAVVLSRAKALDYIDKYNKGKDFRTLRNDLKKLMVERENINNRILDIINQIFDVSERFSNTNPLLTLEFEIPEGSEISGRSINETNFWHNTGATIVAIRHGEDMILSPGPYYVFSAGDVIIVTGDTGISKRIESFIGIE